MADYEAENVRNVSPNVGMLVSFMVIRADLDQNISHTTWRHTDFLILSVKNVISLSNQGQIQLLTSPGA